MQRETWRIGAIARAADVHIQTLRYYERRGILPAPRRSPSGYREYSPDAVQAIRFIKRAQDLGFTLREVQELLRLRGSRTSGRSRARAAAAAKLREVDAKIAELRTLRRALEVLLNSCGAGAGRDCPILEALERGPAGRSRGR